VFTVALIGPDGAGKTTVSRRLEAELALPVKSIYMGVNLYSSSTMLPHMRLIFLLRRRMLGADPNASSDLKTFRAPPKTLIGRFAAAVRSGVRLTNWLAEEWYRQAVAAYYTRRGTVVVFDRHFFADFYEKQINAGAEERRLSQRIHGFVLQHLYPKPDLVICLDAPAEVLFARKPEGSLDRLRKKRADYRALRQLLPDAVVVDAAMSTDDVTREVVSVIRTFQESLRPDAPSSRRLRGLRTRIRPSRGGPR
jgi:thymidylate kinase